MLSQGYFHTDKAIPDNFKVLFEQGKIVKVGLYYGVPIELDDGTVYIETPANKTIAVWKVKPDGQSKCKWCDEFGYYECGVNIN